jgi:phytoene desaturase
LNQKKLKKVNVIGAGFSGIAAATCLQQKGFDVTVLEKNEMAGGRARKFSAQGFTFDMGPSWYWMPDVFEKYFNRFGKSVSDYYELKRLNPSYRIYYGKHDFLDIPQMGEDLRKMFEELEPGSWNKLLRFLEEGKFKYEIGVNKLVYNPGLKLTELLDWDVIKGMFRLQIFSSLSSHIRKYFKNPRIIQLLEFPVLFLGAAPENTPALYSLMNYADLELGTWYPKGGMHKVVTGMTQLATDLGVKFMFDCEVNKINMNGRGIKSVEANGQERVSDYIVASADYHFIDQHLLPVSHRKYNAKYWDSRLLAPSALIFFVGLNKKIKGLLHHTLFFDQDFKLHAKEIYENPQWPTMPQFYISCPSQTDPTVAPEGFENLMILIPVAPGLKDTDEIREKYFTSVLGRLETILGEELTSHIVFKRSYAHQDFMNDYHALKGNAYGLANTLMQTANLKPSMINPKINNLVYTGQLTVPGPGVPPSLISGQVAATLIEQKSKLN